MHYFTASATKWNHNVIELPLWALAGFAFYAALRRDKLGYWVLLGVAIGLAWWAKYFMVVLAAPFALFLIFDRDARRHLASPGPWIAAAVALAVMAPHLIWLVQNDFLPFNYAEGARDAVERLARSPAQSGRISDGASVLSHSLADHRRTAVLALGQERAERKLPTLSTAAS